MQIVVYNVMKTFFMVVAKGSPKRTISNPTSSYPNAFRVLFLCKHMSFGALKRSFRCTWKARNLANYIENISFRQEH